VTHGDEVRRRVRLWPAYAWRGPAGLALLAISGWFLVDIFTRGVGPWAGRLVFALVFTSLAVFALQLLVGHLLLTDEWLEVRQLGRRQRLNRSDVATFEKKPFNRSFLISVLLLDGGTFKVPFLIQGSVRSQEKLLSQLRDWKERGLPP
jgi:hypothetical protein